MATLSYCVSGPAVAFIPAVGCVPAVVGGHIIVVILAVAVAGVNAAACVTAAVSFLLKLAEHKLKR